MPRKKIAVYSGHNISTGTLLPRLRDAFHGAAVDSVTAKDLRSPKTLNRDTLAFILPGIIGEDSPYKTQLGKKGNAAIRKYVEDGGVFVGICAGAYYACRDIVYTPPWRTAPKTSSPGLNLFNALAKGPLPGLGLQGDDHWFSDCSVTKITYGEKNKKTGIAYGNGPALFPDDGEEENIEVLARYEDVPGKPIAVAAKKVGKGLAIFVGVLPYIGYDPSCHNTKFPDLHQLMENLKPHERGRKALWEQIVSKIKEHNADLGRVTLYAKPKIEP